MQGNIHESNSDIEEAFLKLSSYIYFEKQNLHLREQLAVFINENRDWKGYLSTILGDIQDVEQFMNKFKNKIDLIVLPKTVQKDDKCFSHEQVSGNFYTNQIYLQPASIEKLSIFINLPIELHVLTVLWIMKYGTYLDQELSTHCLGNRLHLDKNKNVIRSRTLFYRYEKQYQKWWSDGIKEAKTLFEKKEDVTIVNFDFKEYYHSIQFDFEGLTKHLKLKVEGVDKDPLHRIILTIHQLYYEKVSAFKDLSFDKKKGFPLPIGMLSSYVLANWYLKDFDSLIMEEVNPNYYGRYVDDLMIVIKNTVIENFQKIQSLNESVLDEKYVVADYYIKTYFDKIFRKENVEENSAPKYCVAVPEYGNIRVQLEKFFLYQFNSDLSPNLLNKFVEEQRERSSAFQFLSDDEDDVYKDIDEITFESSFDNSEISKSRFKNLEDNKYKLSVYLAKLIRGSVISGPQYEVEEVRKLKKYFKGFYLIKNYYFWEKLFTLHIIREEYNYIFKLHSAILSQIEQLTIVKNLEEHEAKVKSYLTKHAELALKMAIGLYPDVVREKKLTAELKRNITSLGDLTIFRRSGLLRKSNLYYPILHFSKSVKENSLPLFSKQVLEQFFLQDTVDHATYTAEVIPYRVKFYECCLFIFHSFLGEYIEPSDDNLKRIHKDFIDVEKYLETAFRLFSSLNYLSLFGDEVAVKAEYFKIVKQINDDSFKLNSPTDKLRAKALKIPNSRSINEKLRICLVNKYVDFKEYQKSLEGRPDSGAERFEEFNQILDDIKKVKDCDLFVMPELALPYHFINYLITQTTFKQVAMVTGIEHWKIGNIGFNFLLSSFPLEVFGDKDSVPIFRVKNHYAPIEEEWIQGKNMIIPKPEPYCYELVQWRGVYLSTYNCFELADLNHRHLFYGMVDVIIAPIWNPDMHYYNSLIETASRDMHCYFALSNTTQYGDSRITEPSDHINRDKLRVKGGTVSGGKSSVLVADLKIHLLRYMQTHQFKAVKEFNRKNGTSFKPLPPDFPYKLAELRMTNKLFKEE